MISQQVNKIILFLEAPVTFGKSNGIKYTIDYSKPTFELSGMLEFIPTKLPKFSSINEYVDGHSITGICNNKEITVTWGWLKRHIC